MNIESVMPSKHLTLCHPLLFLPSIFPTIRVFSSELAVCTRWPEYWSFSIRSSNEYSGLISFRMDWFDLLAVQETLQESSPAPQLESINSLVLSLLYSLISIHTWLLEKPYLWLYGPMLAKWCLCFLICCQVCHSFPAKKQVSFNLCGYSHHLLWFWSPRKWNLSVFPLFPHLFAMKWWDQMPWS